LTINCFMYPSGGAPAVAKRVRFRRGLSAVGSCATVPLDHSRKLNKVEPKLNFPTSSPVSFKASPSTVSTSCYRAAGAPLIPPPQLRHVKNANWRSSSTSSGSSFLAGWCSTPRTTAATSQLARLISMITISVLSWSRAVRHLFRSFWPSSRATLQPGILSTRSLST
jgi:hypothetical protein